MSTNSTRIKTLLFLLLFANLTATAQKAEFSLKELVSFTSIPIAKFDDYISRKGFRPQPDSVAGAFDNSFYKVSKDKTIQTFLGRADKSDTASIFFQTSSLDEFNELKNELVSNGFVYPPYDSARELFPPLYQRANVRVYPSVQQQGDHRIYALEVQRKQLPRATDITFAEDLMQLASHEYLATVFGPSNVKKDLFYFSEKEMNRCSVLFPNTGLQVIFIWKDQGNHKGISLMLIGGQVRAESSQGFHRVIEMNKWRSAQGVYLGMSLTELEKLNDGPLQFYGWESEQPGIVSPKSTGKIDFKKLGIQLDCLDCYEDKHYSNTELLNSTNVLQQNGRVYVSTLILIPEE